MMSVHASRVFGSWVETTTIVSLRAIRERDSLTVAAVSFVSFILAGLIQNVFVNLLIAVALMVGTLLVIRAIVAKKHAGIFAEMAEANKALAK